MLKAGGQGAEIHAGSWKEGGYSQLFLLQLRLNSLPKFSSLEKDTWTPATLKTRFVFLARFQSGTTQELYYIQPGPHISLLASLPPSYKDNIIQNFIYRKTS